MEYQVPRDQEIPQMHLTLAQRAELGGQNRVEQGCWMIFVEEASPP